MSDTLDASGLSCPQPVLLTLNAIKKRGAGKIVVLVDTAVSKENVSRMAANQGWEVAQVTECDSGYRISITKE